jgi:hypothetical protein
MMLKLHKWSQEIWSKNVIFKCNKFLNWYDLNMQIINVIADDETKIGLYEIYVLDD